MISISQAVMSLRHGTEWSMNGDDVENIIWHTEGVEPLTRAEVDAEITRLQAAAVAEQQRKEAARASAVAHAKSLGFTDEMISVMYPTLVEE